MSPCFLFNRHSVTGGQTYSSATVVGPRQAVIRKFRIAYSADDVKHFARFYCSVYQTLISIEWRVAGGYVPLAGKLVFHPQGSPGWTGQGDPKKDFVVVVLGLAGDPCLPGPFLFFSP